jgi:hypothetical protein
MKGNTMKNNKQYFIKCTELVSYEIVVNATSEDQAIEKANKELLKDPSEYCIGGDGFQFDVVTKL